MSDRLLLAFQYWSGDRDQLSKLLRLVTDLEPRMSETADIMFSARFDCAHDEETIKYVARRFRVHTHINRNRRGVGWPSGCNDLAFGTLDYVYSLSAARRLPQYKAIALLEADGCPLRAGWIETLSQEWDKAKVKVFGPMQNSGPKDSGHRHINGNCLISADQAFLHWFTRKQGGCSPSGGWDYLLAPMFKRLGWADCKQMVSWWNTPTVAPEQVEDLINKGVVYFHGAKDDVVPPAASEKMIDALKKYNSNVKFTLYPDANHNSWDVTYDNDSLYTWLLSQKKFRYKTFAVEQQVLKEYEGSYVNNNQDTV